MFKWFYRKVPMTGIRINAKHGTTAVYGMRVVTYGSFENRVARVTSAVFSDDSCGDDRRSIFIGRGKLQFVDVTFDFCPFHSLLRLAFSCEINHY